MDDPARFPSPFATPPHPIAQAAAEDLIAELRAGRWAHAGLDAPGGGKMFGVLVVRDRAGERRVLRAFSGMLAGSWYATGSNSGGAKPSISQRPASMPENARR